MPYILLFLGAGVGLVWFASEFQDRRWLRLLLGCAALVLIGGSVGLGVMIVERFNSNAWYGVASGDLIDATVAGLEAGRKDEVVAELKRLRGQFQPTYENRARYDHLVEEYVARVKQGQGGKRADE
jgi:hypothetical protein